VPNRLEGLSATALVDRAAMAGELKRNVEDPVSRWREAAATKMPIDVVDRVNGTMQGGEPLWPPVGSTAPSSPANLYSAASAYSSTGGQVQTTWRSP
jgi:hypothetical protein